jgi:hypothetical protein
VTRAKSLKLKMMGGSEKVTEKKGSIGAASFMDSGLSPGADFFEESSGDEEYDGDERVENEHGNEDDNEGDWEDEDTTREFSVVEGLGLGLMRPVSGDRPYGAERGRGRTTRKEMSLDAMPPFNQLPAQHDSATGMSVGSSITFPGESKSDTKPAEEDDRQAREEKRGSRPTTARQMSLRRLRLGNEVRIVHNVGSGSAGQGTPRTSGLYSTADPAYDEGYDKRMSLPQTPRDRSAPAAVRTRHRRNTSESTNAVIQAHLATMRVLESISPSASLSAAHGRPSSASGTLQGSAHDTAPTHMEPFRSPSFTANRHINIAPLTTQKPGLDMNTTNTDDPDRPSHLPPHFIRTPYPFAARKEFPKPRTGPRHTIFAQPGYRSTRVDPRSPHGKAKHVLGLKRKPGKPASPGVRRVKSERVRGNKGSGGVWSRGGGDENDGYRERGYRLQNSGEREDAAEDARDTVVYVSLRHRRGEDGVSSRLEKIVIPGSLTTCSSSSPSPSDKKASRAQQQQASSPNEKAKGEKSPSADRADNDNESTPGSFDDHHLARQLHRAYRSLSGSWFQRTFSARKLKYIRVQRVSLYRSPEPLSRTAISAAAEEEAEEESPKLLLAVHGSGLDDEEHPFTEAKLWDLWKNPRSGRARYTWVHWARRLNPPRSSSSPPGLADDSSVLTIQFTHSFSIVRILAVLSLILALSVAAALLWIFLGVSGWGRLQAGGRGERVGPGMLVGVLALAVQGVVFLGWLGVSWWCVP